MSKSKEIERILKLLEEKKITSEEAKKLLDALSAEYDKESSDKDNAKRDNYDTPDNIFDKYEGIGEDIKDAIAEKMRGKYSDLGEDIRKSVLAGISNIKNNILESLSSDIDNSINSDCSSAVKREYELVSGATVKIKGANSCVNIKRGTSDKVILSVSVSPFDYDVINELLEIEYSKDCLAISVDDSYKAGVTITLFLPDMEYADIDINTTNGSVNITDVKCTAIMLASSNGQLTVKRCTGSTLKVETSNGQVRTEGNNFDNSVIVKSTNGSLISKTDISKMIHMETTNGSVRLYSSYARSFKAETTNGSTTVNINRNFGAVFECSAGKHGAVRLGSNLEAQSAERNMQGRIIYAKGESRYAYKSVIIAAADIKTDHGQITMDFV
ncbi:MAG TPA: DUF4097 family beta strand repeat-containing protein [Clostridia bacterium]|nr:DUF4097 family beta strand repeat-containing protein [Clostridia bacterium]